ncbi:hypothetical protein [Nostoc sp.]|uniref:hypothetical protein n=1 Tax=Nostoc sp. TaxID=1180 RepID=UPI002FF6C861
MMTKATLNTQNPEITRNYITHLLQQLTDDYKNTKEERKKLGSLSPASDEEFTVLEEMSYINNE